MKSFLIPHFPCSSLFSSLPIPFHPNTVPNQSHTLKRPRERFSHIVSASRVAQNQLPSWSLQGPGRLVLVSFSVTVGLSQQFCPLDRFALLGDFRVRVLVLHFLYFVWDMGVSLEENLRRMS